MFFFVADFSHSSFCCIVFPLCSIHPVLFRFRFIVVVSLTCSQQTQKCATRMDDSGKHFVLWSNEKRKTCLNISGYGLCLSVSSLSKMFLSELHSKHRWEDKQERCNLKYPQKACSVEINFISTSYFFSLAVSVFAPNRLFPYFLVLKVCNGWA